MGEVRARPIVTRIASFYALKLDIPRSYFDVSNLDIADFHLNSVYRSNIIFNSIEVPVEKSLHIKVFFTMNKVNDLDDFSRWPIPPIYKTCGTDLTIK